MKVLFLLLSDIDEAPYIDSYIFDNVTYDCISIDKGLNTINVPLRKNYQLSNELSTFQKVLRYKKLYKKVTKKNNYNLVVILHTQLAIILNRELININSKMILDIRDYTYENMFLYRYLQAKIIKKSEFTVLSSNAFKNFLPEDEYVLCHNYSNKNSVTLNSREKFKETNKKIVIGQIGFIRFLDINNLLISIFNRNNHFELHYYGKGSEKLTKNKNVRTIGKFNSNKTVELYNNLDIINNIYGYSHPNVKYALSNKLYLAAQLKIPILVSPNTEMQRVIEKYNLGFCFNHETDDSDKELSTIYKKYISFDWDSFYKGAAKFINDVEEDNAKFERKLKKVLELS